MKKNKQKTERFLVIAPHRDMRQILRKYFNDLINAGLKGVYEFPHSIPVARIFENLTDDELKSFARKLREAIGKEKFTASKIASVDFSTSGILYGSLIKDDLSKEIFTKEIFNSIENKINNIFSQLVIGSFLASDNSNFKSDILKNIPAPEISFRAAAVANMSWKWFQSDEETAFKWKIGKLCWLPKR